MILLLLAANNATTDVFVHVDQYDSTSSSLVTCSSISGRRSSSRWLRRSWTSLETLEQTLESGNQLLTVEILMLNTVKCHHRDSTDHATEKSRMFSAPLRLLISQENKTQDPFSVVVEDFIICMNQRLQEHKHPFTSVQFGNSIHKWCAVSERPKRLISFHSHKYLCKGQVCRGGVTSVNGHPNAQRIRKY